MSDEVPPPLVPRGQPTGTTKVALHPQAYSNLMRVVRITMPADTAGALIGEVKRSNGTEWIAVREAEPVRLVPSAAGQSLDPDDWADLESRFTLAGDGKPDLRIVGWYYTHPDLETSSPSLDIASVQPLLRPDAPLFLLVNPMQDEGAFYLWRDGSLVPTGGFYEVVPHEEADGAEPALAVEIPWRGEVAGAAAWLPIRPEIPAQAPEETAGAGVGPAAPGPDLPGAAGDQLPEPDAQRAPGSSEF